MARQATDADVRRIDELVRSGVSVSEACRRCGVDRSSYYKAKRRAKQQPKSCAQVLRGRKAVQAIRECLTVSEETWEWRQQRRSLLELIGLWYEPAEVRRDPVREAWRRIRAAEERMRRLKVRHCDVMEALGYSRWRWNTAKGQLKTGTSVQGTLRLIERVERWLDERDGGAACDREAEAAAVAHRMEAAESRMRSLGLRQSDVMAGLGLHQHRWSYLKYELRRGRRIDDALDLVEMVERWLDALENRNQSE